MHNGYVVVVCCWCVFSIMVFEILGETIVGSTNVSLKCQHGTDHKVQYGSTLT